VSGVPIVLSQTKPDFESLVLQLQIYLSTKGAWIDQQTSGTGQALIESISAVGTFNQFATEMSFREAFLYTAQRDSSIYAGTDFLGVHVTRKTPARVQVQFRRTQNLMMPLVIPRLSAFTVDGRQFFNRDPVTFASNSAVSEPIFLHQGELRTRTFQGRSVSFQEIYLEEPGFVVSDRDVNVFVVNTTRNERDLWSRTENGLWIAGTGERVYYDRTDGDGDVILTFGDGTHGAMPSIGYNIEVQYAVTTGSAGNNGGSGLSAVYNLNPDVQGLTLTAVLGGADEKPSSFYKNLAPSIYKARSRAVTPSDYKALAADYPGVASVVEKGQRDIAPGDLRWMNVVRLCVLPYDSDQFSEIEWADFLAWMEDRKHAAVQIQKYNPIKREVDVKLTLALKQTAIPGEVYPIVESAIRQLFEKEIDTLGKRIAVSDIIAAADVDDVDYVHMVTPTQDFYVDPEDDPNAPYIWWSLRTLEINMVYSERRTYNDRK
jgi:hypothetical protein